MAAMPTDFIVMAAKAKGIIPPMMRKVKVRGSSILTPSWKSVSPEEWRMRVMKAPKRAEGGGADGEALADGNRGVADGIEGVGLLADVGIEPGHLSNAAGLVAHGAV